MSTHYQLQVWNGSEYINRTTGQPGELRDHYHDSEFVLGYRIVDTLARDQAGTQLPLDGKANWASWASSKRRRLDDGLTVKAQAELAATHYIKLRKRHDELVGHVDFIDVAVYPVKPSGRGIACEFRLLLASLLTTAERTGAYWNHSLNETRIAVEKKLADHGFRFVEVDLEDYS